MFRYITPIIMIAVSLGVFFAYTDPVYKDVKELRTQVSSYDEALANSKKLEEAKNVLNQQYNTFTDDELERLRKLLPDNVDNIRLILEIESVAVRYGMTIKNVEFDVATRDTNGKEIEEDSKDLKLAQKEYGIFDLSFSTEGTYPNFVAFLEDIEKSLRIVDINQISFTSPDNNPVQGFGKPKDLYQYDISLRTYWLKN